MTIWWPVFAMLNWAELEAFTRKDVPAVLDKSFIIALVLHLSHHIWSV